MKDTLKLFAAAASEVAHTGKANVAVAGMVGTFAALAMIFPPVSAVGIGCAVGVGRAVYETGVIYKRMKNEQKLPSFNHG